MHEVEGSGGQGLARPGCLLIGILFLLTHLMVFSDIELLSHTARSCLGTRGWSRTSSSYVSVRAKCHHIPGLGVSALPKG